MGQSWSDWKQDRSVQSLRELVPEKTPGHDSPLPKLNRETLLKALEHVAASINKAKGNVTVIAVGGAVNTIHLRSRDTTHDVDFFNEYITQADFAHLVKGVKKAIDKDKKLGKEWFNNRTVFFIPQDRRQELSRQAFAQNEVIFQRPGLTILAAPWNYAFCCKVDRLSGSGLNGPRNYDLSDAVEYLARYCSASRTAQVSIQTVKGWAERFSLRWGRANDVIIAHINAAYQARFKVKYNVIV